jgi:phosphatidylinositol alpha-1,6-mannosyltransferase
METLAGDIDKALRQVADVQLVALRSKSLANLAWFLPLALVRTALALIRRRVGTVVCGDAITWATVAPVVKPFGVRSTVMVLGLDLSFPNALYQRWIRWALGKADTVIAISAVTGAAALERGADAAHMVVVNPSIRCEEVRAAERATARAELVGRLALDERTLIVLTLGRLVRRKGVSWFIENVLPEIADEATYLVAGEGPMRGEIEASIASSHTHGSVRLLGRVDDELRSLVLCGADVFVMPNIRVPGDMEGFGLVAVEAACRGAVVLASALEGISEAVVDGATGILVEPERPEGFVDALRMLAADRERLADLSNGYQAEARRRFAGDRMARELQRAMGL